MAFFSGASAAGLLLSVALVPGATCGTGQQLLAQVRSLSCFEKDMNDDEIYTLIENQFAPTDEVSGPLLRWYPLDTELSVWPRAS